MIRVVSVTGFHGVGKTRVVVAIVRELTRRGYKVGTVKHIPEREFTIDQSGKDTWSHAKAGAKVIVSLAPKEVTKIEKRSARLDEVLDNLQGLDFVVVEGFKSATGLARVVVARSEADSSKLRDKFTIACVGRKCLGVPSFNFRQIKDLADVVEEKAYPPPSGLDCKMCGYESCELFAAAVASGQRRWDECQVEASPIAVIVDGKRIPIKRFVQEIFEGTHKGMVSSLHDAEGKSIEIKVVRHEG